jgi:hypothetical protein
MSDWMIPINNIHLTLLSPSSLATGTDQTKQVEHRISLFEEALQRFRLLSSLISVWFPTLRWCERDEAVAPLGWREE